MPGDYIESLVGKICATYQDTQGINHLEGHNLPRQREILDIIDKLLEIVFPGFNGTQTYSIKTIKYNIGDILTQVYSELLDQTIRSFRYVECGDCDECDVLERSEQAVHSLLDAIPEIRESMKLDIGAAYDGDPAAMSTDEIVVSYPGIKAITVQRFAHVLYHQRVPLIPRMMTEYVHSVTGIDIHPGAHLEKGVFIDHGTGVVIGETAVIGNNVKIYQGVTLGALSFPKDACGMIIKGSKRHPTLEDNVTIYSGATVLGDITIGAGATIGGNVWITENVPPKFKITVAPPENRVSPARKK
ncbi:MAG: serine acetyltransferase [Lentisphaerae bacterium]|nr:serine acetyltransferase [Lentisphaerota bacterium]MCP4101091.1 serine acetyltransferase [Lentisphaerota bacterium]